MIAFRSVAWFGLITFVPLWEVSLGNSKAHGSHLLSLMLLAGGVGTLVAGPLADRLGRRPVLIASLAATAPLILVYVLVGGVPGAIALAFVGVCVISTFGVTMVMAQEYLPTRIGMASGPLDRAVDRPRRDRRGRPRRARGLGRPAGGDVRGGRGAARRARARHAAAIDPRAAPARARAGSVGSRAMEAREFFESLETRVDPAKAKGLTASYKFVIDGAGTWHVDVDDGHVKVTEDDARRRLHDHRLRGDLHEDRQRRAEPDRGLHVRQAQGERATWARR